MVFCVFFFKQFNLRRITTDAGGTGFKKKKNKIFWICDFIGEGSKIKKQKLSFILFKNGKSFKKEKNGGGGRKTKCKRGVVKKKK